MPQKRIENTIRNVFFGIVLKIYQVVFPFILRTLMIYHIGIEYVGLGDVFTSVLQILNVAELGVGAALVFTMYKPVVEDNTESISSLLKLYRFYYRIIGLVVLLIGILIIPFLDYFIAGEIPEEYSMIVLYLLSLMTSVFSYWFFAYKNSVFQAYHRVDIISKIRIIADTVKYILQIFSLVVFKNYYMFLASTLVGQIISNILVEVLSRKKYPKCIPEGEVSEEKKEEISRKVKHVFTAKLGAAIQGSSDSIVISAFLGLNVLAMYQNYYLIILSVIVLFSVVFQSSLAGIGNSLVTETKKKNYEDLEKFTYIVQGTGGLCVVLLLNLYQPLMEIWVGKENMFSNGMVILLCLYFYIAITNQLLVLYKDAAGMWSEDRFRPLLTGILNLTLNIILVRYIGIYGILLSTIISMLFLGTPWLIHNVFLTIFKCSSKIYVKKLVGYFFLTLIACVVTSIACSFIQVSSILGICIRFIICMILGGGIILGVLVKKEEYKYFKNRVYSLIKKENKT